MLQKGKVLALHIYEVIQLNPKMRVKRGTQNYFADLRVLRQYLKLSWT